MDNFWENNLEAIVFSFLILAPIALRYIIRECLNYDGRLLVDTEREQITSEELEWQHINMYRPAVPVILGATHEVSALRDNWVHGNCIICLYPTNY